MENLLSLRSIRGFFDDACVNGYSIFAGIRGAGVYSCNARQMDTQVISGQVLEGILMTGCYLVSRVWQIITLLTKILIIGWYTMTKKRRVEEEVWTGEISITLKNVDFLDGLLDRYNMTLDDGTVVEWNVAQIINVILSHLSKHSSLFDEMLREWAIETLENCKNG